jgi:hypothetical protein
MKRMVTLLIVLSCIMVIMLATGPKVQRFKPSQGQWTFKGNKNPQHSFLRSESKAIGPML